jgi:hypothetical protein
MKNILVLTLIATGLAISLISATTLSASAQTRQERELKRQEGYREREREIFNNRPSSPPVSKPSTYGSPTINNRPNSPSNSGGSRYSSPSNNNNSGSGGGYGSSSSAPLSIVFAPSVILTNGLLQYGVQAKFLEGNFNMRTGAHFGGGSSIFNGGFTYSFGDSDAMFNPFIGGGLAYNPSRPVDIDGNPNFFSFYSTAGVDIKLSDSIVITGSVKLPSNSNFGTEYQASFNLFGGQY